MKNIFVLSLALIMSLQLMAQQNSVSGTVIDSKDRFAMIAANIIEKGTVNDAVTDIDGRFRLSLTTSKPVLVISSIGYETQEISIGNLFILNIEMKEDTELLNEVVVVGYGTIIGTNFNRDSFRANLYSQLNKWLKLGLNTMYSQTNELLGLSASQEGMCCRSEICIIFVHDTT